MTANSVALSINNAGGQALPSTYQVDCKGDRFEVIAKSLLSGDGNDVMSMILNFASDTLEKPATQKRDRSKPCMTAKGAPGVGGIVQASGRSPFAEEQRRRPSL